MVHLRIDNSVTTALVSLGST